MAIAFARVNSISRQRGQSSVASAAYRACENLHDERHEKNHDFTKKRGHLGGGLILPDGVVLSREELWNLVEETEKRCDARLAKEILVALPKELTIDENRELSMELAKVLSKDVLEDGKEVQYPVDWNMHEPHIEAAFDENGEFIFDENGKKVMESNENYHVHIMVPERYWDFETGTFSKKKDRNRNKDEWLAKKKLEIGEVMNKYLRDRGYQEVDFRDFETRNKEAVEKTGFELDKPQKHKGPAKTIEERRTRREKARVQREIKNVEQQLMKMEKEESKGQNKNEYKDYKSPDLSNWMKNVTETKKPADSETPSKKMEQVTKEKSEPKKTDIKPVTKTTTAVSVVNPAVTKKEKVPEQKTVAPSVPVATETAKNGSAALHGSERKTRCLLCGIIQTPECEKCKFRDKDNDIFESYDSGMSR